MPLTSKEKAFIHRNEKASKALAEMYRSGARPDDFDKAYGMTQGVAGLYVNEAKPVWDFLRSKDIGSVAEVGRCFSVGIFLMCCAARGVKRFLSLDIWSWDNTDEAIKAWASKNGIELELVVCSSLEYQPDSSQKWDLVFIDGGHTGEIVTNDILKFHKLARYIGFHDFADKGGHNKHKRVYQDVVDAIAGFRDQFGWKQACPRGRSEIIFDTGRK